MKNSPQQGDHSSSLPLATEPVENGEVSLGNVYVMKHSFFSDVIRIGCTPENPEAYAKQLSAKSPGEYQLLFSLTCSNPCQVKRKIRAYLNAQKYVNEFYQVSPEVAEKLLKQESLRIPMNISE